MTGPVDAQTLANTVREASDVTVSPRATAALDALEARANEANPVNQAKARAALHERLAQLHDKLNSERAARETAERERDEAREHERMADQQQHAIAADALERLEAAERERNDLGGALLAVQREKEAAEARCRTLQHALEQIARQRCCEFRNTDCIAQRFSPRCDRCRARAALDATKEPA